MSEKMPRYDLFLFRPIIKVIFTYALTSGVFAKTDMASFILTWTVLIFFGTGWSFRDWMVTTSHTHHQWSLNRGIISDLKVDSNLYWFSCSTLSIRILQLESDHIETLRPSFVIRQEEGVAEKTPACPDPERPADAEVWFGCAVLEG